jgi:hypothetical protein
VISGALDPEQLGRGKPSLRSFATDPVALPGARVFQAMFEMTSVAREAVVPPALHPTIPPALVILAWQCPASPFGPFSLIQVRAQVRSGVRPRGLVLGALCDSESATTELRERWGFPAACGRIEFRQGYDATRLLAERDGAPCLEILALDPTPLAPGDVQFSATLNPAHTERGLRLVQVEPELVASRSERLSAQLLHFDGAAWNEPRLDPYHPVSASISSADIRIPALRYVCRPDVMAFVGTEAV